MRKSASQSRQHIRLCTDREKAELRWLGEVGEKSEPTLEGQAGPYGTLLCKGSPVPGHRTQCWGRSGLGLSPIASLARSSLCGVQPTYVYTVTLNFGLGIYSLLLPLGLTETGVLSRRGEERPGGEGIGCDSRVGGGWVHCLLSRGLAFTSEGRQKSIRMDSFLVTTQKTEQQSEE